MKCEFWAIVSQLEKPGQWNMVGLSMPGIGSMPIINRKKEIVEMCFEMIDQNSKDRGAKIIKLVEVVEESQ